MWEVPRGGIRGPPGRVKTSGSGKPFLEQVSRHMLLVGEAPWGGSGDSQEGQGGEGKQSLGREYPRSCQTIRGNREPTLLDPPCNLTRRRDGKRAVLDILSRQPP